MEKTVQINFQIKAIELLDSSLSAPTKPLTEKTAFQFDISIEHRINPENKILIVVCSINIFTETTEKTFGKIRTSCIYDIPNLPDFYKANEKQSNLPESFINTLNSISISTTRGLMFSYFKGTFLHNAVLPIIDPTSFKLK